MMSMGRRIHPQQMEAWVAKLQSNMRTFLDDGTMNSAQKLAFVRQQYTLLDIIIKVLNGSVYFVGCSHPNNT